MKKLPCLSQPAAAFAATAFVVVGPDLHKLDGRLQGSDEFVNPSCIGCWRALLIEPLAGLAEPALGALAQFAIVSAELATLSEVDFAIDEPARVFEQLHQVARNRPCILASQSRHSSTGMVTPSLSNLINIGPFGILHRDAENDCAGLARAYVKPGL